MLSKPVRHNLTDAGIAKPSIELYNNYSYKLTLFPPQKTINKYWL